MCFLVYQRIVRTLGDGHINCDCTHITYTSVYATPTIWYVGVLLYVCGFCMNRMMHMCARTIAIKTYLGRAHLLGVGDGHVEIDAEGPVYGCKDHRHLLPRFTLLWHIQRDTQTKAGVKRLSYCSYVASTT